MGSSIGVSPTVTREPEFVNGGGVSRTASTTAKIEAAAPMVSDSVATAAAALAGEDSRRGQDVEVLGHPLTRRMETVGEDRDRRGPAA